MAQSQQIIILKNYAYRYDSGVVCNHSLGTFDQSKNIQVYVAEYVLFRNEPTNMVEVIYD